MRSIGIGFIVTGILASLWLIAVMDFWEKFRAWMAFVSIAMMLSGALVLVIFFGEDEKCRSTIVEGSVAGEVVKFDGMECKYRTTMNAEFGDWIAKATYTVREE